MISKVFRLDEGWKLTSQVRTRSRHCYSVSVRACAHILTLLCYSCIVAQDSGNWCATCQSRVKSLPNKRAARRYLDKSPSHAHVLKFPAYRSVLIPRRFHIVFTQRTGKRCLLASLVLREHFTRLPEPQHAKAFRPGKGRSGFLPGIPPCPIRWDYCTFISQL
jgi:hypothetical protein